MSRPKAKKLKFILDIQASLLCRHLANDFEINALLQLIERTEVLKSEIHRNPL